jgi:hypothetical protein
VHKPKARAQTRTSADRAEPSFHGGRSELAFPGRPDHHRPRDSLLPKGRTGRDRQADQWPVVAEPFTEWVSTLWAPFRGNSDGMGAFGGPFSPRGRPLFRRQSRSLPVVAKHPFCTVTCMCVGSPTRPQPLPLHNCISRNSQTSVRLSSPSRHSLQLPSKRTPTQLSWLAGLSNGFPISRKTSLPNVPKATEARHQRRLTKPGNITVHRCNGFFGF